MTPAPKPVRRSVKLKTCANPGCNGEYTPTADTRVKWCSFDCAIAISKINKATAVERWRKERDRAFKQETKARKEAIKSKSEHAAEAQDAVNLYARVRDAGKPCVSCDWPDDGTSQRHASHFRSVKACSQLRFNTFNIHASCAQCNSMKSGNLLEYRKALVVIYGTARVEWLECQNEITKYEIDYLRRVKRIFNKRARHLRKLRGYE